MFEIKLVLHNKNKLIISLVKVSNLDKAFQIFYTFCTNRKIQFRKFVVSNY